MSLAIRVMLQHPDLPVEVRLDAIFVKSYLAGPMLIGTNLPILALMPRTSRRNFGKFLPLRSQD